jgi:alkaline phosphatase
LDFDRAIGKALEFAEKDGETLVIVTSDHETGGLTLVGGNINNKTIEVNFSTDYHTADMVPVFAYGPGAEEFTGIYENTDVFHKMMQALGLE